MRDSPDDLAVLEQPTLEDEISYLEMTRYMRNQLLRDSDVMSMAWSLELRTPLVDRKFVEAVGRVPAAIRLAGGNRLLQEAVPELPAHVLRQSKRGFQFPFDHWVREEWHDIFAEIDRITPRRLMTWYRYWSLFMLIHFLRSNNLDHGSTGLRSRRVPSAPREEASMVCRFHGVPRPVSAAQTESRNPAISRLAARAASFIEDLRGRRSTIRTPVRPRPRPRPRWFPAARPSCAGVRLSIAAIIQRTPPREAR